MRARPLRDDWLGFVVPGGATLKAGIPTCFFPFFFCSRSPARRGPGCEGHRSGNRSFVPFCLHGRRTGESMADGGRRSGIRTHTYTFAYTHARARGRTPYPHTTRGGEGGKGEGGNVGSRDSPFCRSGFAGWSGHRKRGLRRAGCRDKARVAMVVREEFG